MVGFSMSTTPSNSNSDGNSNFDKEITNEQWDDWNNYIHDLLDAKEVDLGNGKAKKNKTMIGILNLMIECGYIPQPDAEYDSTIPAPKGEEDNSKEELENIEKYPNNYFKWEVNEKGNTVRKHCRPQNPEQELVICIDFPDIQVDYSKHPIADSEGPDIKPLRISLNGRFKKDFNRHIVLRINHRDKKMNDKNILYKIADKGDRLQEFIDNDYNPGVLSGVACKWDVVFERNISGDKVYYKQTASSPSTIEEMSFSGQTITVEDQIPKCDVPFTGIMLNGGEYGEETLKNLRREFLNVMKKCVAFKPSPVNYPDFILGCDWADTDLAKALKASVEAAEEEGKKEEGDASSANSSAQETPGSGAEKELPKKVDEPLLGNEDFDDDIPF